MNILEVIQNDSKLTELLHDLNEKAKQSSSSEYGLPLYSDAIDGMKLTVIRWLISLEGGKNYE